MYTEIYLVTYRPAAGEVVYGIRNDAAEKPYFTDYDQAKKRAQRCADDNPAGRVVIQKFIPVSVKELVHPRPNPLKALREKIAEDAISDGPWDTCEFSDDLTSVRLSHGGDGTVEEVVISFEKVT